MVLYSIQFHPFVLTISWLTKVSLDSVLLRCAMNLQDFFLNHPKVAIAFSGGVDSVYLLYAAKKYAEDVCAYYVKTAFQPQFELDDARCAASELDAKMKIIELDILSVEDVVLNPWNRCYFCKKQIFSNIMQKAVEDGYEVLLDGTNASDDIGDRPGFLALQELKVLSPLRMCELTKAEIRRLSKEAGLFTWNKPAYACLATRIPTGQTIHGDLLQRTEWAENFLLSKGFTDFRVRCVEDGAKIQIIKEQLPLFIQLREEIVKELKKQYKTVCLDLEMRNENGN